jgi:hypothetical protein
MTEYFWRAATQPPSFAMAWGLVAKAMFFVSM